MRASKAYFYIVKASLLIIIINLCVFMALILLINTSGSTNDVYDPIKLATVVFDKDDTELSNAINNYLDEYIIRVDIAEEDVEDALFYVEIAAVITIPEGFAEKYFSDDRLDIEILSTPDSYGSFVAEGAINNYLQTVNTYLENNLADQSNYITVVNSSLEKTNEYSTVNMQPGEESGNQINFFYLVLSYILCSIIISVVGIVMISFKSIDIKRRLDISPISIKKQTISLIINNYILGGIILVLMIVISFFLYQTDIFTSTMWLFILNAFVFTITVISISYLITTFTKSIALVTAFGTIYSLAGSFFCGVFVPQFFLSESILTFARFLPNYWYIRAINIISENGDILQYYLCLIIEIAFALVFIIISIVVSKIKMRAEA